MSFPVVLHHLIICSTTLFGLFFNKSTISGLITFSTLLSRYFLCYFTLSLDPIYLLIKFKNIIKILI